ncbi:hypothetical protein BCY91_04805 [Pelobium manganitolerans]|uniref:Lipoprotein n=1 Tax=Pelobium manganitolerans TaxID=1842495 RepID=A0A419S5S6_9SPHI|nr:hypothetical protein [Pelobium manganitolerans]RKD16202.1 hypothetical protein BCY91_04805 [Pelobium manganitolerans]
METVKITKGLVLLALPALVTTACSHSDAKYKNLQTGEKVYIIKSESGQAIDSVSGKPVEFYVDLDTKDTIYGETGEVVNNKIVKTADNVYKLDESKFKSDVEKLLESGEDVKVKRDGDELKIKTDDKKIKIEDGETKVKDR